MTLLHPDAQRAWLLLAAGDDRQHGGNLGYDDTPSFYYSWDETVANHDAVQVRDAIAIWDKKLLLGASVIEEITYGRANKQLLRCSSCGLSTIKGRKTLRPLFKCYSCKAEFDRPVIEDIEVTTYRSRHDAGWIDLAGAVTGPELRQCCVSPRSQHSLRPLNWGEFVAALDQRMPGLRTTVLDARLQHLASGHRLRSVRVRVGQGAFRQLLLGSQGHICAFTGPTPSFALEACHLYSSELGKHHLHGGILLRRDIHRLFDLGHLSVDPKTMTIDVATSLEGYPVYANLQEQRLQVSVSSAQRAWLADHWSQHRPSANDSEELRKSHGSATTPL